MCACIFFSCYVFSETNCLSMDHWLKTGCLKKACDSFVVPVINFEQIEIVNDDGFIKSSTKLPVNSNPAERVSDSNHLFSGRGVKRKYDESYLSFGFTWKGSENCPDAFCVICQKITQNSPLARAKMKRHFERNHPTLVGKNLVFRSQALRSEGHVEICAFNNHFNQKIIWSILFNKQKKCFGW